jgi:hypothetical protein
MRLADQSLLGDSSSLSRHSAVLRFGRDLEAGFLTPAARLLPFLSTSSCFQRHHELARTPAPQTDIRTP